MATAGQVIESSLSRAAKVYAGGVGGLLTILKEADANLSKRLHGAVHKAGGPNATFTEASFYLHLKQIRLVTEYLEKRLVGYTHEQAMGAVKRGVASTTRLAKRLNRKFTGIARPLAIESVAMQDVITRGVGASLLRQHQSSVGRYGKAMIADFERVMKVGALEGLSQHQVISRLVQAGELGGINAATLHAKEPASFPDPTGYVDRRYWAERILRTETAYAHNAAGLGTIQAAKVNDFPDMQKKILAHFDNRTAPDSIAVHGQVRPVDGYFVDGAGRQYLHPPARPNDRETVVPWRPAWGEIEETRPAPAKQQKAAAQQLAPALKKSQANAIQSAKIKAEGIRPAKPLPTANVEDALKGYPGSTPEWRRRKSLTQVFGEGNVPTKEWWHRAFQLPEGYRYDVDSWQFDDDKISWGAWIMDKNGKGIGKVRRTFVRKRKRGLGVEDPIGTLVVKHELLKIDREHRGTGIASSVLAHSERAYGAMGVKEITLDAAWDGRVVWARYGFDWESDYDADQATGAFREWLQKKKGLPQGTADAIASRMRTPRDILIFEHDPPDELPSRPSPTHVHPWEYGREFLMQSEIWSGKIERNGGESHKIWKKRLAEGEAKLRSKGRWKE